MKFTIKLTQAELETIDLALQALPFGRVNSLYYNLKNQVEKQIKDDQSQVSPSYGIPVPVEDRIISAD